jgi:hypothetical protein
MNSELNIFSSLLKMSKIELLTAKMSTDNEKFRSIIQATIDARFPPVD